MGWVKKLFVASISVFLLTACATFGGNSGGSSSNPGGDTPSNPDTPKNKYVVSFNSNGGSSIDSVEVEEGQTVSRPTDPTKDGFDFAGWYKNSSLTNLYDFSSPVYSSFILYAKWDAIVPETFTINFISNGSIIATQEIENGGKVVEPEAPEWSGYTFCGWYTSNAFTTLYDFDSVVTSAFNLYAKWSTQEFLVTFNLNYNNLPEVQYPTELGYVTFIPERSGYVFNGWWYCDGIIDGTPILNRSFSMSTRVTAEGLELFAEWIEEKEYSNQLDAPVVTIDGYNINWETVQNATSYQIVITARVNSATTTFVDAKINQVSYQFNSSLDANTYTIKVRAIGDGVNYRNSAYTTKVFAHKTLTSVRNFSYNEYKCLLQWDEVNNATGYTILIDNLQQFELTDCFYDFTTYSAGSHTVRVTATRSGWISSTGNYTFTKWYLSAPINLAATFNKNTKSYDITWSTVKNADSYRLYINDNLFTTVSTNKYSLHRDSNYFVDETIEFAVEAFDSNSDYFVSPKSDSILLTKIYLITYNLNGGTNNSQNVSQYTAHDDVALYDPSKVGSTFVGWTINDVPVVNLPKGSTGDVTISANWSINTFTITWLNCDGSILEKDFNVPYGSTPSYDGATPTFDGGSEYTYTFTGWSPSVATVKNNAIYTATYSKTANQYSVSLINDFADYGIVEGAGQYSYGTTVTISAIAFDGYAFDGWYENDNCISKDSVVSFVMPSKNVRYNAKFVAKTIKVIWQNFDGEILEIDEVSYGGISAYNSETPVRDTFDDHFFNFTGWTDGQNIVSNQAAYSFEVPTHDVTLTAIYDSYLVSWLNYDETVLELNPVQYGETPSYNGATPTRDEDSEYVYEFGGWNAEPSPVNGDTVYTATFISHSKLTFTLNNYGNYYVVSKSSYTQGAVVIPSTYNGLPVKSISANAFKNCTSLTSITIPESIDSIGTYAFDGCSSLQYNTNNGVSYLGNETNPYLVLVRANESITECEIPEGCRFVCEKAFMNCTSLTSVCLPDSLARIGDYTFSGCSHLSSCVLPSNLLSIGKEAFKDCTLIPTLALSNSITSIDESAFKGCSSLNNINLPSGLLTIESNVFNGCSSLTSISIPTSVTSIYHRAFDGCSQLTSITIPVNVSSVSYSAFDNCSSLNAINVNSSNSNYSSTNGVLFNKNQTTLIRYPEGKSGSYTIPNTVTSIGDASFYQCSKLSSVTIPTSVKTIGGSAFSQCDSLVFVSVPDSVTEIGSGAFYGCNFLKSVVIGTGVNFIGNGAFEGTNLWYVYYKGTSSSQWNSIQIMYGNNTLNSAIIYYYSSSSKTGNYWHYVNGTPTKW